MNGRADDPAARRGDRPAAGRKDPGARRADDPAARPVVLVGLMGSGKTTVGRLVAQRLGRSLRDSDEDLERVYGASAARQYQQHGVEVLHRREAEQLRRALAEHPPPVVAAAASVVNDPACLDALAGAYVVWLDAPVDVLASRVGDSDHRPHFDHDPRRMLDRQHRQRAGRFREVADLCLDVELSTPEQTAAAVLAGLNPGSSGADRPAPCRRWPAPPG